MKIAVDLRTITFGESGGLTQWMQGTLEHLIRADPANEYLVIGMPYNYHLLDIQVPNLRRVTLSATGYTQNLKDRLDYEGDIAVLFRCLLHDVNHDFPIQRQVVCIPDRRHEFFPDNLTPDEVRERRRVYHYYQSMAGAIGTLTDLGRRDLIDCPWTGCPDVFLMPPALPDRHAEDECAEAADGVCDQLPDSPFFLYPANLWPYKNHRATLEAFARFHQTHPDVHFVFTGYNDGWALLRDEFKSLPIRHLGYLPPARLAAVYRRAHALVFLSRYEAFGLPLLEAFAAGIPVLCAEGTGLAEVGGDAVVAADPASVEAMTDGMVRVANDQSLRRLLVERGRGRLAAFSWQQSAESLRSAFERVARRASSPKPPWTAASNPPIVSVVTPSFNQGRYIKETIDSVLSQDYPHIDFRVIDGGSTDETLEVLRSYGDRFPWLSEKDRGQTHAINKGLALAKGSIQTYLNSDDILRPGAVSKVVKHFLSRPACDLVYGRDAYIDPEGAYLGFFPTSAYSFEKLLQNCCISQPAAFWRDRIARVAGPFDESLYSIMDYEYWMRLDRAGAVIEYLPEMLASTRMHADAKTSGGLDYLHRRFVEMVCASGKHAGRISEGNLTGYLQQVLYQRWPILKHFPRTTAEATEAWFTFRYIYGCRPYGATARAAERTLYWLLGLPKFSLFTRARDLFRERRPRPRPTLPRGRWGPHLHNMLRARTVFGANVERGADEIRLVGRALCDLKMSLRIGNEALAEIPLEARQMVDLRVPFVMVPNDTRLFTIEFSHSVRCPVRGDFSFELLGTNLFGERFAG